MVMDTELWPDPVVSCYVRDSFDALLNGAPDGHPAVNVELFAGTWPFLPGAPNGRYVDEGGPRSSTGVATNIVARVRQNTGDGVPAS